MLITVHPPNATKDVHFLGYDSANGTGSIKSTGIISFELGYVVSGVNGDILVVYEPDIFPDMVERNGMILNELVADENRMDEDIALASAKQEQTIKYGIMGITIALLAIFSLFSTMLMRKRIANSEALPQVTNQSFLVPIERLSMPATIYYTNRKYFMPIPDTNVKKLACISRMLTAEIDRIGVPPKDSHKVGFQTPKCQRVTQ